MPACTPITSGTPWPPHAVGYALADKPLGTGHVSVRFSGDGPLMAGAASEATDLAALRRLPVIFCSENSLDALSTPVDDQTRLPGRGVTLGLPSLECDSLNLVSAREAMSVQVRRLRPDVSALAS